ncbi:hypothetical protein [Burkholderia stabilis]|uniref:hypothetical protein n=1 Tax=Burkholderia stabilis TaxID=95485 RepID=UPI001428A4A0|nr:hypothetical protein [Burkholderia stabilis]
MHPCHIDALDIEIYELLVVVNLIAFANFLIELLAELLDEWTELNAMFWHQAIDSVNQLLETLFELIDAAEVQLASVT